MERSRTFVRAGLGLILVLCLVGLALGPVRVMAAGNTCFWQGPDGGVWSDPANWSACGAGVPQDGDAVRLGPGPVSPLSVMDLPGLSLVDILLENVTHTIRIDGSTLTVTRFIQALDGDLTIFDNNNPASRLALAPAMGAFQLLPGANHNLRLQIRITTNPGVVVANDGPGTAFLERDNTAAPAMAGSLGGSSGILRAEVDGALGSGAVSMIADSTLWLGNGVTAVPNAVSLGGATTGSGSLVVTSNVQMTGPVTLNKSGNNVLMTILVGRVLRFPAGPHQLGGEGRLVVAGGGRLDQDRVATFTLDGVAPGQTRIDAGTIRLAGSGTLPAGGLVDLAGTGVLEAVTDLRSVGPVIGSGSIRVPADPAHRLIIGAGGGSGPFSGTVEGDGILRKAGDGTWIVSGNALATGQTEVADGVMVLGDGLTLANWARPIRVQEQGRLTGTGSSQPVPVTVAAGAVLAPANGVGTMLLGDLILNPGAVLELQLGNPAGTNDRVQASGTVQTGGVVNVIDAGGFAAHTYTIITAGVSLNPVPMTVGTLPPGFDAVAVPDGPLREARLAVSVADSPVRSTLPTVFKQHGALQGGGW